MPETNFLCALDLVDTIRVRARTTDIQIYGWIMAIKAGLKIDQVFVECDGKGRYPTSFPQPRPDVKSHYPDVENAASSGFVTSGIPVQFEVDEAVEISVIAKCGGVEHHVLTKRVRLVWFNADNELFSLGKIGPFRFPEEVDEDRLTTYPECAPVFLMGTASVTKSARHAVLARIPHLSEGGIFLDLLSGLVECHDIYTEHRRKYFTHIEDQIGSYAISRFDIYEVLNSIIATVHNRVLAAAAGTRPVYMLTGLRDMMLLPLIGRIYPHAQYVYLRPGTVFRWIEGIANASNVLSKSALPESNDHDLYGDAYAGRTVDRLLRILTQTGKFNIGEFRWSSVVSGRSRAERLVSRLNIDVTVSGVPSQNDTVVATQPARSAPTTFGYLQVIPEFSDASPIFVLGAGRSGTSAAVGAMNAAGIEGFSEGHLFPMLNEMAQRLWQRFLHLPTPPAGLGGLRVRILEAVLSTAFASAYGGYGRRMWIDKTPDHPMIECIPFLRALFPRARFLMMIRHPVAFAESRRRKFGESVLSAANEWVRCIRSWQSNKTDLAADQYLEVDLSALGDSSLLEKLSCFLELDDEQRKDFIDYLVSERPEFTRAPPKLMKALEGLDDERGYVLRSMFYGMLNSLGEYADAAGWGSDATSQVMEVLGRLPEEYGYKVRRPDGHLEALLCQWAVQLEDYRHTAEYHQKNAAYWAEQARNLKVAGENREEH